MNLIRRYAIFFALTTFLVTAHLNAQSDSLPARTAPVTEKRLEWWRDARFGMFIHWGPVSLVGTEISWSRGGPRRGIEKTGTGEIPLDVYDNLYKRFNPTKFNAGQWVSIARSAGMKYMVLTAKHCDGFCLWHTEVDSYSIANTPFKRDVCRELATAARDSGLRIGWYYSPMDWRDPDCRTERNAAYVARMQTHLSELLGNYGRISVLWFDADGGPAPWDQENTYHLVRSLQPDILISNRLDIETPGYHDAKTQISPEADFATPEQQIGTFDTLRPWETCMTLGTQWSWKPNDSLKTAAECISILIQCATGDGNLLLDVGPMPSGEIEPRQVEILRKIGTWLGQYGESIYGTRGGPLKNGEWGGSTRKGYCVYLHIQKWDGDQLRLPPLGTKIVRAEVITGGAVAVDQNADGLIVKMPQAQHDPVDTIVKLEMASKTGAGD